jgi:hypothetical protein
MIQAILADSVSHSPAHREPKHPIQSLTIHEFHI